MPRSTSASSASRSSWHADPAPLRHHSITELLHDPRSAASPEALPPAPPSATPARKPRDINDFADYLRAVDAPYRRFLSSRIAAPTTTPPVPAPSKPEPTAAARAVVPSAYFDEAYSIAASPDLSTLSLATTGAPSSTSPAVAKLRATLSARAAALEAALHAALTSNSTAIASALDDVATLRAALRETKHAAEEARMTGLEVAEAAAADAPATAALGERRDTAVRLVAALSLAARVKGAAEDAHLLVDASEFPAAMAAVRVGRRALGRDGGVLGRVKALEGARASLGTAVERIDAGLREHIRVLIGADLESVTGDGKIAGGEVEGRDVRELARLVARLGRSALAHRGFLEEVRRGLEKQLEEAEELDVAAAAARAFAKKAALVHSVFTVEKVEEGEEGEKDERGEGGGEVMTSGGAGAKGASGRVVEEDKDSEGEDEEGEDDLVAIAEQRREDCRRNKDNVRELYDAILDMMCGVLDRLVGTLDPSSSKYIVLLANDGVNEANFFDEAKGALRFADAMRTVDGIVNDLAAILGPCCAGEDVAGEAVRPGHARANALRSKVLERSLAYVNAIGKAHSEALTTALHDEKWTEVRVSVGVLRLVACLTGDSLPAFDESPPIAGTVTKQSGRRYATAVIVHGEDFKTVSSGLRYVRSICAFALFADKLPFASSEAARRGVELSRQFNALSGRAILGAAALQWAKLRSITARHLALASRTVSLAIALAPHVGAPLQNAVSEAQVSVVGSLMQQSEKDLRDHHSQLLAKIMFIMMERLSVHEEALVALPWSKQGELHRYAVPSAYVATLVKEATMLHRILWSVLPAPEVVDIFTRVCIAYDTHLSHCYAALDHSLPWVRKRIVEDVAHLHEGLRHLDVVKMKSEVFVPIENVYKKYYVDLHAAYSRLSPAKSSSSPASARSAPSLALPKPSSNDLDGKRYDGVIDGSTPALANAQVGLQSPGLTPPATRISAVAPPDKFETGLDANRNGVVSTSASLATVSAVEDDSQTGVSSGDNQKSSLSPASAKAEGGSRRFLSLSGTELAVTGDDSKEGKSAGDATMTETAVARPQRRDLEKPSLSPIVPATLPSPENTRVDGEVATTEAEMKVVVDNSKYALSPAAPAASLTMPISIENATSSPASRAPQTPLPPVVRSIVQSQANAVVSSATSGILVTPGSPSVAEVLEVDGSTSGAPAHAQAGDNLLKNLEEPPLFPDSRKPQALGPDVNSASDDLLGELEPPSRHAPPQEARSASSIPAYAATAGEDLLKAAKPQPATPSTNGRPPN